MLGPVSLLFAELDPDVTARIGRIECFDYETKIVGRVPRLEDIASRLDARIAELDRQHRITFLTLVAHSQGGLLARHLLVRRLEEAAKRPTAPRPLYRLLRFATPQWGAYSSWAQKAIEASQLAPQVAGLGFDADSILLLNERWGELDAESMVVTLRVIAQGDIIVPYFSALGADFKRHYEVVADHGHGSVVEVSEPGHPSYSIAKRFLPEPASTHPELRHVTSHHRCSS